MSIFQNILLKEKIKLEPKFLTKNYHEVLKIILNKKISDKCTKYGFIKSDSINIYKINPGEVEQSSLNGYCIYNVHFYADLCNPYSGQYIKAKINNINAFGILALSGYNKNNKFIPVLEIIIAKDKNNKHIASTVDIDNLNINDNITIEVIGKKFQLGDLKIQIVGRVVDEKLSRTGSKKITERDNLFDNDDIDNFNDYENLSDISDNEDSNNDHDNESSSHSHDINDDDEDVIIDDDDDKNESSSVIDPDD